VRIEVRTPINRILPLDFETWHFVLNGWYLPLTDVEDQEYENRPSPRVMRKSWERVFDLAALRRSRLWGRALRLQGVVEYLEISEVVRVDRFTAR